MSGYPAAHYAIPTDRPTGDVRVGSFGLTAVQPRSGGPTTNVAHVRLIVANNSDEIPWTIDTREAVMVIAGEGNSRPAFVNTDAGTPPVLQIARGEQRMIDLYYPLPSGKALEETVPAFDVTWRVQTATADVVQRTPFERERVDRDYEFAGSYNSPYGYYGYYGYYDYGGFGLGSGLGFAPYWWYDAHYPRFGFYHHPAIVVGYDHRAHYPLHVTRPHGSIGGHYRGGHGSGGHHSGGHASGGHYGGGHHGGGHR